MRHRFKDRMRKTFATFLIAFLPTLFALSVDASDKENTVPYGTYCYSKYGGKGDQKSISRALGAVRIFFKKRGYYVKLLRHDKRFMTVAVYNYEGLVDTVVVDIRSGRIRSIK